MGWKRRNNRHYYYSSVREGGRHRTVYRGGGEFGHFMAVVDLVDGRQLRREREAERAALRERLKSMAEVEARLDRFCRGVEVLFRLGMEAAGYHRHDRGAWRKARMGTAMTEPGAEAPPTFTHEQVQAAVDRAQGGDKEAVPLLRQILKSDWRESVLTYVGCPYRFATAELITTIGGRKNQATQTCMGVVLDDLLKRLTPAGATPLEELLARRVVVCWLGVCSAEYTAARCQGAASPRGAEAHQRCVDRAHRRLLSGVQALASFRKVAPPSVILNVLNQATATVEAP